MPRYPFFFSFFFFFSFSFSFSCCCFFFFLFCSVSKTGLAVELDEAYKFLGDYRVVASAGIRLYFPAACEKIIPRILKSFQDIRNRLILKFPDQKTFEATVLLTDHDDRESASIDATFDLVTLGLYEEMGSLSTRSYSIDERFALRLAFTLIMRTLGSAKTAIQRKIGLLSIPPWYLEGLALYLAFPLDVLHTTRLLDMARRKTLYSIQDLDTIQDRRMRQREDMSFQVHSMIEFWHRGQPADAGLKLLRQIRGRPGQFSEIFKKAFGTSLESAFQNYRDDVLKTCAEQGCASMPLPEFIKDWEGSEYAQSARTFPDGTRVWVSSRRYTEEVYDLWLQKSGKNPRVVLRNVHPAIWADPASGNIYVGKYELTAKRERRLFLWEIPARKRACRFVNKAGSFKPLGKLDGRLVFLNLAEGNLRVLSADLARPADRAGPAGSGEPTNRANRANRADRADRAGSARHADPVDLAIPANPKKVEEIREEFCFPSHFRPLEVALDPLGRNLYFVLKEAGRSYICRSRISEPCPAVPQVIHSAKGSIRSLAPIERSLFFCSEADFRTLQVFRWQEDSVKPLTKLTAVPGGVWDFTIANGGSILITTLSGGKFRTAYPPPAVIEELTADTAPFPENTCPNTVASRKYTSEFLSSYWLPKADRDARGGTFGVYSYRADRLDRSHLVFSPTFGIKSRDWGYSAEFQKRFDLWRAGINAEERVVGKSYRSKSYYERVRSFDLRFSFPFNLSTALTFGGNLTHRGIAKFPVNGGAAPSVGRDHSIYWVLAHQAIRTEPFWQILPRKGRRVTASHRKGLDLFSGELKYGSTAIRWEEYIPIGRPWVVTARAYIAEDDKEGNIRRPDDLGLGGTDFLRGYQGSVRFGDSLRAFSLHLARPITFSIPALHRWIQEEFLVAEGFWEMGDARFSGRRFSYLEDRGFEVRMRALIFRRLPISVRWGTAWPLNEGPRHTYWTFDFNSISGLL